MPVYKTLKLPTDPTYDAKWSGVTYAPKCRHGRCSYCNYPLHHEGDSHYCPGCDDFRKAPPTCKYN